jgi:hypothetical protein
MGEYAKFQGHSVKIGTCENMYYLRWDQKTWVVREEGSINPYGQGMAGMIRFRFPFPDEDHVRPGDFGPYNRGVPIECPVPVDVSHNRNCKSADLCAITQQKHVAGVLMTICRCESCHVPYRLEGPEERDPLIDAVRTMANRAEVSHTRHQAFLLAVADRVLAGYTHPTTQWSIR